MGNLKNTIKNTNLEWYVLNSIYGTASDEFNDYPYTFYHTDIRPYNVFNNHYVHDKSIEVTYNFIKTHKNQLNGLDELDELEKELMDILRYEEFGRTEYEIQVVEWPERVDKETNEILSDKVDCYMQVLPNSKIYTDYVYDTVMSAILMNMLLNSGREEE